MYTVVSFTRVPNGLYECNITVSRQSVTFYGTIFTHPVRDLVAATSFLMVGGTTAQSLFLLPGNHYLIELKRKLNRVSIEIVKNNQVHPAGNCVFIAQTSLTHFAGALYWAANRLFLHPASNCRNSRFENDTRFHVNRLYSLIN